ncbi:hypothetical protein FJY84_03310 [Candidatus Bathyarchaeota archaeon]|nr:hypothetical protein [Candidatus Bathyarchaeota archaeon]
MSKEKIEKRRARISGLHIASVNSDRELLLLIVETLGDIEEILIDIRDMNDEPKPKLEDPLKEGTATAQKKWWDVWK